MTYDSLQPETIQHLFADIAAGYDRCNQVMSFNMHRRWNQKLIESVVRPTHPQIFLDLCAGTGDIAFAYLNNASPTQTYLVDFCPEMLEVARNKAEKLGLQNVRFIQGDAQEIPLPDQSVDCVTIAYGIRNVASPESCIRDVFRVLRADGRFGVLELTRPANPILAAGHKIYLKTVLPILGRFLVGNKEAYKYLCNSIQAFVPVTQLEGMFSAAGFTEVKSTPLLGGVATIVSGMKLL